MTTKSIASLDEALGILPAAPMDGVRLCEHAKITADALGHPHRLTKKEWDASHPSHSSEAVVAKFRTWKHFVDCAGIDAYSREYEKQYNVLDAIVTEFLDKLEAAQIFEYFDCPKEELERAISLHLTGCA